MSVSVDAYLNRIILPKRLSHKGENGKLLVIGGSDLFHAASAWSLEIASRMVDLVFYSSTPENNALVQEAKRAFWNGIVVPRDQVESYIQEADCALIGPGMTRDAETAEITQRLLKKYSDRRWVVDAGALQMADAKLFTSSMILTPHSREFVQVFGLQASSGNVEEMSRAHGNCTVLLKGPEDVISDGKRTERIPGGNAGMTKGGTGDVLAGLVAALYTKNEAFVSAVVGSYLNKRAGDELYREVGSFFNATDLMHQLPKTMKIVFRL